jgi:uncharacterized phage protein (TIGR02216 family)
VRTDGFPWARVMRLGMGVLMLPPHVFWRMTLRELVAAFSVEDVGVSRARLEAMMGDFPDE